MDTKVKAVIDLMTTLGVSLEDVAAALNKSVAPPPPSHTAEGITFHTTRNGMTYAAYKGLTLGIVLQCQGKKFVLSAKGYAKNTTISETRNMLERCPVVDGKRWIVPYDEHFIAIRNAGMDRVNTALREIGGDRMSCNAYLSATSQANQPASWGVRIILPL